MQRYRTEKKNRNYQTAESRSTAHAKIFMETSFFVQCIFYILHIIPLRMTNCSQGINQKKKVYFILLGIIH